MLAGWLLDLYPADGGIVLWLIADRASKDHSTANWWSDPQLTGTRLRLWMPFPVTFFAAGPPERLRSFWRWLRRYAAAHGIALHLARTERRDIFLPQPVTLLSVQVADAACQTQLFAQAAQAFPELTYYDADLPLPLRHAAVYGTFPLARLQIEHDPTGRIQSLQVTDTPWEMDPEPAPLRVMSLVPDCDPRHTDPRYLQVRLGRRSYRFALDAPRPLLITLAGLLHQSDPDLLLTTYGDTWLLPYLLEQSEKWHINLPLNRDPEAPIIQRDERSYQAYGRVVHRGRQVLLSGRWHIDTHNAMMFSDYDLDGVLESARVSALPVQQAARLSPGAGITAMQIVVALRQGILTPWHKQQAEAPKTTLELIHADQGGLVYQPLPGLYHDVAEIDFISMYPSIMARFNISPETIATPGMPHSPGHCQVPALDLWIDQSTPGLVPQTLQPLLDKRIALKHRIAGLPTWDPRRKHDKAQAAAHKWLLVTCFGYLGYKNARFGRIEAHQAVTAYSRECLLQAKEAAEEAGFEVLHLYVDGLWVRKSAAGTPAANTSAALQPLLDEIAHRTGLPIALEGIYRWVVFMHSKVDPRLPVANRYFGAYQDGTLKLRGIEARRADTPLFIAHTQIGLLERLAPAEPETFSGKQALSAALAYASQRLDILRRRAVPLEDLLVTLRLSRNLDEYRSASPGAQAAAQLQAAGKATRPGMSVRLLYLTQGTVHAWDCPPPPDTSLLDIARYTDLFLRACASVLTPFGIPEQDISSLLRERVRQLPYNIQTLNRKL